MQAYTVEIAGEPVTLNGMVKLGFSSVAHFGTSVMSGASAANTLAEVRALLDVNSSEVREAAGEYLDGARDSGSVATGPAFRDAFRKMEMRRYLHDQLLRDTDVFSMAHSIEVRVPYLDHIVARDGPGRRLPEPRRHRQAVERIRSRPPALVARLDAGRDRGGEVTK